MPVEHPLHRAVGDALLTLQKDDRQIILDPACGGKQKIPLFMAGQRSRQHCLCFPDAIIVQGPHGKAAIRGIIEIEETSLDPTTVCGKFLTSALACGFVHESTNGKMVPMADSVLFLQIVDMRSLKRGSMKMAQWRNLEWEMGKALSSKRFAYRLLPGTRDEFAEGRAKRGKMLDLLHSEGI